MLKYYFYLFIFEIHDMYYEYEKYNYIIILYAI